MPIIIGIGCSFIVAVAWLLGLFMSFLFQMVTVGDFSIVYFLSRTWLPAFYFWLMLVIPSLAQAVRNNFGREVGEEF